MESKNQNLPQRYLRSGPAAEYIGVKHGTASNWRSAGIGPRFSRSGGIILYAIEDLDAFVAAGRVSTLDQP